MNIIYKKILLMGLLCAVPIVGITITQGDFEYSFNSNFRPEMFYGKNISLLNDNNPTDKQWYMRHIFDIKFGAQYGKNFIENCTNPVVDSFFSIRNKGVWGNPESVASTTFAQFKLLDAVTGSHNHAIPRHIFWMREAWLSFDISEMFNIPFGYRHTYTLGAFPFELGRGISLGSAYASGPDILGFYTDGVIDQYAFGAKFSGDVLKDKLNYDLYSAILQNKSSGLSDTGAKILGQAYDRIENPARGFGKINFLIAGRLIWHIFENDKYGHLSLEPYALYNFDPEQKIEFLGDAESRLGTIGLAAEYESNRFGMSFDYAMNLGQQKVLGWDRNQVRLENRAGTATITNSHVRLGSASGDRVLYTGSGSEDQKVINNTFRDESQNSKNIGTTPTGNLFNANNRFRNPYENAYEGWMFVLDAQMFFFEKDLRVAVAAGIATGDENPNVETIDGVYSGFIGLQEVYSGKNVRSAFLLGGAGKLKRPLSEPEDTTQALSPFAQSTSGFTNLVFCGTGAEWKPASWQKSIMVNPNILAYWQEKPVKAFDAESKKTLDCLASTFLGMETNVFVDYYMYKNLKLYFVGSIFFPGDHYRDVQGRPLNDDQKAALDILDGTGFDADRVPNLGTDKAYTINIGLDFRF